MRLVDADTVEISGGGHLTGDVSRQADSVVIRVDDEIHIALPGSRVRRVVESDQLAAYRAQAAKAGDDAELHYQLAVWCVTASNVPGNATHYRNHHLQRVKANGRRGACAGLGWAIVGFVAMVGWGALFYQMIYLQATGEGAKYIR